METINYKGCLIKIEQDEYSESPREWDSLGTMVCWHSRYNLGDKHSFDNNNEFQEFVKDEDIAVLLPLFLYDHSGITMNTTGFSCPWDSGQAGWIYITKDRVKKEYSWKNLTRTRLAKIREYLVGEVKTYDDYLTGNVYGFTAEDKNGEEIDSRQGFFGDHEKSGLLDEAKGSIDYHIDHKRRKHLEYLKSMIRNRVPLEARLAMNI